MLPICVLIHIVDSLNIKDVKNWCELSKECHSLFSNLYFSRKKDYFIKKYFCNEIIDLFSHDVLKKAPILKWKHCYRGCTGYIDNIQPSDMSHSIMIGIDCAERPFIALKWTSSYLDSKNRAECDVLFQRYSNIKNTWTHGCNNISFIREAGHFMINGDLKHSLIKENINNLIHGIKLVQYESFLLTNTNLKPLDIWLDNTTKNS